ncbi:hypothetical protein PF008_g7463 [Phytophthora fragariae]|uniref:No apical meristem-associated C-terminal domain-containing protein n=2 Tax=Phytophthora TaxID=4783 RepID=A0A6G0S2F7_9STRA|nr:hypothetical protein PF008_g7463 [Phytophthora fragariae]
MSKRRGANYRPHENKFPIISHAVSKFVACHTTVVANCASGRSPLDVEHDAVTLCEAKNGAFKYMQCWYVVLRGSPKWGAWRSGNDKRKTPKTCQREGESDEPDTTAPAQWDGTHSSVKQ